MLNRRNYSRSIEPAAQAQAQREANMLAQGTMASYSSNMHPLGAPAGCFSGTGVSQNMSTIRTCEPSSNRTLVAEAFAQSADGTWYSSRAWR